MARAATLRAMGPTWHVPHGPRIKPGAVAEEFNADGNITTYYSSTCSHCQHITNFESRRKMHESVDVCRGCMKLICLECVGKPCGPYEKVAEWIEACSRHAKALGLEGK